MLHKPTRSKAIVIRVDPEMHAALHSMARELGVTVSGLVYAELKQHLKDRSLVLAMPAPSVFELQRIRARDFRESMDWSTIDAQD